MRDAFPGYFRPSSDQLKDFMTRGMIAFDTNALFDAYRLNGNARREFFSALHLLRTRLWIPHRVGLEFMRGRLGVIHECVSASNEVGQVIERSVKPLLQQLGKRRGLNQATIKQLEEIMDKAVAAINDVVAELYKFDVPPHAHPDEDPIFMQLEAIIEGKIGPPLPAADVASVEREGLRRIAEKIPPGYKDKHKDDPNAVGDYVLWEQMLREATVRQVPVLFVTRDAKEDWIWKEHGQTQGPRVELTEEMAARAGQPFHLVDVTSFLRHADTYLSAHISSATLEQAESLSYTSEMLDHILDRAISGQSIAARLLRKRLRDLLSTEPTTVTTALAKVLGEFIRELAATTASPQEVLDAIRKLLPPSSGRDGLIAEAAMRVLAYDDPGEKESALANALLTLMGWKYTVSESGHSGDL